MMIVRFGPAARRALGYSGCRRFYNPPYPPRQPNTPVLNTSYPSYSAMSADGFMEPNCGSACGPTSHSFEALTGALAGDNYAQMPTANASFAYDGQGRVVSSQAAGGKFTRSYDAQNHLVAQTFSNYPNPVQVADCYGNPTTTTGYSGSTSYGWGPNGHPIIVGSSPSSSETLHWDGDQLLFTSNKLGVVDDVKVGVIADIPLAIGRMFVWDRDGAGNIVSYHNNQGWSGWNVADPFSKYCKAGAPPSSPQFTSGNSTNTIAMMQWRADGFTDGINYFQGDRSYDPKAGQWMSPDRAGEAYGDPASNRLYAYDRNNAAEFSDPSGNEVLCGCSPTPDIGSGSDADLAASGLIPASMLELGYFNGLGAYEMTAAAYFEEQNLQQAMIDYSMGVSNGMQSQFVAQPSQDSTGLGASTGSESDGSATFASFSPASWFSGIISATSYQVAYSWSAYQVLFVVPSPGLATVSGIFQNTGSPGESIGVPVSVVAFPGNLYSVTFWGPPFDSGYAGLFFDPMFSPIPLKWFMPFSPGYR